MGSCGKYMLIAFPSLWLVLWTKNTFWDFFKVGFRKRVWHWYWQCFKFQKPFLLYPATCVCVALMPPESLETLCAALWLWKCFLFKVFWKPPTLYWWKPRSSRHPGTFEHSKILMKRLFTALACKTFMQIRQKKLYISWFLLTWLLPIIPVLITSALRPSVCLKKSALSRGSLQCRVHQECLGPGWH